MGILQSLRNKEKPDVVVDFILEEDIFYIRFYNSSDKEVYNPIVRFNQSIMGFNSTVEISSLALFNSMNYMAPRKEFQIYIDNYRSFFKRLKNDIIKVYVQFSDARGRIYKKDITHNMAIYRDLPVIIKNKTK
jgi:hypothetical protein